MPYPLALPVLGIALLQNTANVQFNGAILDSCTVVATTPGALAPNGDLTRLASTEAGGLAAGAAVTATGAGYQVTVETPTGFDTAPSGAEANTAFGLDVTATGATLAASIAGDQAITLLIGLTSLAVDATATKSTGSFPGGTYAMSATVRCAAP